MKDSVILQSFTSAQSLRESMLKKTKNIILEAVQKRGRASLALSGGNTPKPFFEALSTLELPWDKIDITLVDERWVDTSNSDSNEYLVRHFLMQNQAAQANFIGLKNEAISAQEGVKACQERLDCFKDDFDLVILGMGEDGHTASFFPKARTLDKALKTGETCVAITPPEAKYERMTLSLSRLLRTKKLFLHIEGEAKFKTLSKAAQVGDIQAMPIRAFLLKESKPYLEVFYAQ